MFTRTKTYIRSDGKQFTDVIKKGKVVHSEPTGSNSTAKQNAKAFKKPRK